MDAVALQRETISAVFLLDDYSAPPPVFLTFPTPLRLYGLTNL